MSNQHCSYFPINPPIEILKIPSGMPSFLDNTPASHELRATLIQHVISNIITVRIFQPFMFTVERSYDSANDLFQTLPKRLDSMLNDVRKIVKLAAGTWRLARVERKLIVASLPSPDHEDVDNNEWDEYDCGGSVDTHNLCASSRHVVLRTLPRIVREAAHEDVDDDTEDMHQPCVYSRGTILFSDSPSVLARREEMRKGSTITDGFNDSAAGGSGGNLDM